ncbi:MAG: glycosyltransferase involved in cell wall biosynthesis [Patiriisocius sp.]|jgi:glycosyltransferase involved in cell wall biosynthesis|tara:strand:- start:4215 stop:5378 length:1164 start_codon:yes stop_codon:yes gene_type:complete
MIILTRSFDPNAGGVQRSTYKISSYFKRHGHETHVYSYQEDGHGKQDVAELHTASQPGRHRAKENNIKLQQLISDIKPDVVINQMPYELEIGKCLAEVHQKQKFLLLGCLRNTLFAVTYNLDAYLKSVVPKPLQSVFDNKMGKKLLLNKHKSKHARDLKFILDTYDYFVMFGPPNKEELKYFVGDYKSNKTYCIPNSILSVLTEVPKKEKRLLWLSSLKYQHKRADLILPFWKKVMHELPDWEFDIVGDGEAFDDLKEQIEKENIPRVKMYGNQVPYEYYNRSPIYIMTSAFEGFPNTLIEAQSYGSIPVIYDSYPICSWVVKEGKSGVLIPPFEIDTMAKEVICLANNQTRQDELMKAALENAREFDLENVGKLWVEFFDKSVKQP